MNIFGRLQCIYMKNVHNLQNVDEIQSYFPKFSKFLWAKNNSRLD